MNTSSNFAAITGRRKMPKPKKGKPPMLGRSGEMAAGGGARMPKISKPKKGKKKGY